MIHKFSAKLTEKKQLTHDVYSFLFTSDNHKMEFKAGQYVIVFVPGEDGQIYRRLYSISSPPAHADEFLLLVKMLPGGKASEYLINLSEGDEVNFQGPAGIFTLRETPLHKVFLATGTGIAPMISMLRHQHHTPFEHNIKNILFWGVPTYKDLYFIDELKDLKQKLPNFEFHICISREETLDNAPDYGIPCFIKGHITDGFDSLPDEIKTNAEYYICGNQDVVESLKTFLKEKGIAPARIFFERFN